jgi:hypothetical protein
VIHWYVVWVVGNRPDKLIGDLYVKLKSGLCLA